MSISTCHLFAGAGGGLLADLILGHTPVLAVEWDAYACRVLRERAADGWFPGLHVHEGDIREFDPSGYAGRVDCIHAGFPCQDISVAGQGSGIEGARSGLWSQVVRVVDAVKPAQVFLENSPAIVSRGLVVVLSDLAAMGFDAKWLVLPASAVGAQQIRARWFCLATRVANTHRIARHKGRAGDATQGQGRRNAHRGGIAADVCHADRQGLAQREGQSSDDGAQQPAAFRADWWAIEPDVGRVADGVAARVDRLRCIGNGQVPLAAAAAWIALGGPIG